MTVAPMAARLNARPVPGKWSVSEGARAGRKSRAEADARLAFNRGRHEMIGAGPFDSEADVARAVPDLTDTPNPYLWQQPPSQ